MGIAFNKNPNDLSSSDFPAWTATLDLVNNLGIPAFKGGLTAMQLVNTLAFSTVVQMPTVEEMGAWISKNPDLGATEGLKLMGFQVATPEQIRASFICFHNYLQSYLTPDDQDELGFHPPFTEHVLCKIPRWDKFLGADKSATLTEIASSLGDILWTPGENKTNREAMPFPLVPERKDLKLALRDGDGE